ncbi:Aspartate aminotransferase, partial [Pseudomonas syringae pv. maculicola]
MPINPEQTRLMTCPAQARNVVLVKAINEECQRDRISHRCTRAPHQTIA